MSQETAMKSEQGPTTVEGTVEFFWDSADDDKLLVNIEPDQVGRPHTFEIAGELRRKIADEIDEGSRIAITYLAEAHEVIDPDSGPSESYRPKIKDVTVSNG